MRLTELWDSSGSTPMKTIQQSIPDTTNNPGKFTFTALKVIGAMIVVYMLWQVKAIRPYLAAVIGLVILGMLLKNYPTIQGQFQNLGK